jgi:predicted metalloprotease with PDZ domain
MRKFLQILYIIFLITTLLSARNNSAPREKFEPTKSFWLDENNLGSGNVNEPDFSFSIEPFYDLNNIRLIVVMEFKGDRFGQTKLMLPNTVAANYRCNDIKYLKPLSPNTTLEDTDDPLAKIVKYPPGSTVKIYYQIEDTRTGEPETDDYYSAIITKQYFHFFGDSFFILPNKDLNNVYSFSVAWNHMPNNWKLANSFGVNQKIQMFNTALWKFRHAAFAGGDFQIFHQKTNSKQLYFAVRGNWEFPLDQLCNTFRDIIISEDVFWNDSSSPFNLEIVLPINENKTRIVEARTNGLSLFLSQDNLLDYNLKEKIASGYFHNWVDNGMQFAEPLQLVYWFKEGICKYYGRLILLRSRHITLNDYLSTYNNSLEEYFTSSYRYYKNEKAVKELWTNSDLSRATILRGEIIAHNLNAAIMKHTNGVNSLDDLIRDIYKRCRTESLVISNGSLGALVRFYAGESTFSEIMRVLNSGTQLRVNKNALGPCFYPTTKTEKRFWFFGEEYAIPVYKLKDRNQQVDKNCLWWFGVE